MLRICLLYNKNGICYIPLLNEEMMYSAVYNFFFKGLHVTTSIDILQTMFFNIYDNDLYIIIIYNYIYIYIVYIYTCCLYTYYIHNYNYMYKACILKLFITNLV